MAPPSRALGHYCELCDRMLVPGANLEEHKAGAIHRGLTEASGKMTKHQLQAFREELKVGRRKQKLPAKRAILEALREPVEPSNWNTGLKQTVHWGPLESAWILTHFRRKGIDIPEVVKDVVGLGYESTQELRRKEQNTTLDSFRELLTDCVLVYEGAVVAVLLHEFVPSYQADEYFAAMAHMWEFGGHISRTCSPETRMAMFGHRFCYNDSVPARFFHSQRSKESLLAHTAEDLEAYGNAWADKFVDTNLRPHLASWLRELEDVYPEELPKLRARLGKTPFTAMGVTRNYVSAAHTDRDVLHSVISWFIRGDVADAGKFVFPGFSLFFRPRSGTVLLLNSSRLSHYTAAILNPAHCQYGCALYVRRSTQTTYVRRQARIEQIGDMLDSAMREANVARRREITAPLRIISENAPPRSEGRKPLDGVLRIKFSPAGIERCEGED
ncbi:unnamed protein product [Sphagnum tenellum]